MTTIVRADAAQDFLALVPQLAGFQPRNSVVLVAFTGNRTCGAMRFDLPRGAGAKVHRRIATTMVGMLSKLRGADAVVPVAYTDDEFGAAEPTAPAIPHAEFMAAIIARAEFSGFAVRDALCVAADAWGSYLDEECPPGGRPLGAITASALPDSIPEGERRVVGNILDLAVLPEVGFATRERVARLFDRYRSCLAEAQAFTDLEREFPLLTDLPLLMECALDMDVASLDDTLAALLVLCLQSPSIRDATMILWAFGLEAGERTFDLNDRFLSGGDSGDIDDIDDTDDTEDADVTEDASRMIGEGPPPDRERIDRAIALLGALAARSPQSARPPMLVMLAWLHWALGRSSVAGSFVDSALTIDPDYGLAQLIAAILGSGALPEWAFDLPRDEPSGRSRMKGPSRTKGRVRH